MSRPEPALDDDAPVPRTRIRRRRVARRGDAAILGLAVAGTAALLSGAPGSTGLALVLSAVTVAVAALRLVPPAETAPAAVPDDDRAALREARDRAEAEAAEKSRRLATAGHEIRTPLHGILGLADLLAGTALTGEQAAHVRAIRTSGAALLGLVDDILDLTRLEAGRLAVTPQPVDLAGLVEDVAELMAPRAHGKGLEFASIVAPGLAAVVEADPILLRQVLINLAGNAVKYTTAGGVALEVEPAEDPDKAGRIAFRVRDTGIGIAAPDAERIFADFERVGPRGAGRGDGAGLGLAIARTLVARMGGTLALASRPGEGSIFAFDLLLPAAEARHPPARPLAGRRVVLVSAGAVEPPLLVRRLHALGAAALHLRDLDALDPDEPFDVALIDGDDRAAAVLARLRAGRPLPAAVLVTPAERARLADWRAAGFEAHLVKPVRGASLARVVAALGAGEGLDDPAVPAADGRLDLLLADDNEINALLGRSLLETLGHRVAVVGDGEAAVAAVERARALGRPFAAVLMDLHMPGMDGFSAIRALRLAETGDGPPLAILALTADGTAAAAVRARACGADATLVKPIERDRLVAALAALAAPDRSAARA